MTVFDLDTPHLNSGSRSEFSGATKPNSSWSQTQLTRPIVALVEAGWGGWMVSRASGGLGDDTVEPQCRQIHFIDERFNNPDRVVLRHVVIQAVRQQRSLPPVLAFHKTLHPAIPQ